MYCQLILQVFRLAAKTTRPYVAPVISAQSTVTVKYYTDARLVCNVTGYPTPSVRWEYNQVIKIKLLIYSIYYCQVKSYTHV